jgi:multisubunit Na+/H+ antiporter MnhF subunit
VRLPKNGQVNSVRGLLLFRRLPLNVNLSVVYKFAACLYNSSRLTYVLDVVLVLAIVRVLATVKLCNFEI